MKKFDIFENSVLSPLIAFVFALLISCFFILISGFNPISSFALIFEGSFGSLRALSRTLIEATPLILSGLAFMVAKKATLINLGVEGQLYAGAITAAIIAVLGLPLPPVIYVVVCLLGAVLCGGLVGAFVAFLKIKFGSNEVITTMMINFIIISFLSYLANGPLRADPLNPQTAQIPNFLVLPKLLTGYQVSIGIVIAVVIALLIKWLFDKTKLGYEIRCVGLNMKAAETAGISTKKIMMVAMLISGGIAGLNGAIHVMGVSRKFIANFSPGYGFSGIAVAALGGDNPLGIIIAGIVFGALKAGSIHLSMSSKMPQEYILLIQAFVVIFVSAPLLMKEILRYKKGGK